MELNLCYVVGTILLYMNKLSLEDLNLISTKLLDKGYILETSEENIFAMLTEWRDFFKLDLYNNILLTDKTKENKYIVELIFNLVLDRDVHQDILNSMLYRNNRKSKIIKF